jgi:DNA polymerase III epsilon subunit-like protein
MTDWTGLLTYVVVATQHRATYDALVAARLFVRLATRGGGLEALRGRPSHEAHDVLF